MKRLVLLHIVLLFLPVTSTIAQETNSSTQRSKPNVLFIMADDLNATLNSLGKKGMKTPNLDRLANQGRLFNRAYTQAPLCNPSRSSLMTGKRPHHLNIWTNDPHFRGVYPRLETLPQYFKNRGYYSVGLGKIFHNWGQVVEGDPKSWSEPQRYHWGIHAWDRYKPGLPYKMHRDVEREAVQHEDVPDEAYRDGRIANAAVEKLRELRETQFFLGVGFWKPHLPYNVPKKYWDLYDRDNLPPVKYNHKVEGVPDIAYVNSDEARSYGGVPDEGEIPDSTKKMLRHGYLAAISYLDAQVGKLLDELDRLGLTDNTIIVFTSDHGYHAGEQGQFGKWTNFEVGTRTPVIISTPDMTEPGIPTNSIAELVDLYPTLIDLCNLPDPEDQDWLDGVSLKPIIDNPEATVQSRALSQIARPLGGRQDLEIIGSSIRSENYRYNVWRRKTDGKIVAEELYDLSDDLYNAQNLIGNSRYEDKRDELLNDLMEMLNK